ncbi:Hypothetical predicted protein [Marmota monax]|uniref:Uncharacterized protein n=1 Tax=Marmota monax TaxID=9995 RepID=A0A5E4A550_MARMO|nr:hypothetical protein GHT09_015830 [Marmota monax]VTJ52248.1 Hypothetical predicted protein [Marmota monax]
MKNTEAAAGGRGPGGEREGREAEPGPRRAPRRAGFGLRQLVGPVVPASETLHRTPGQRRMAQSARPKSRSWFGPSPDCETSTSTLDCNTLGALLA